MHLVIHNWCDVVRRGFASGAGLESHLESYFHLFLWNVALQATKKISSSVSENSYDFEDNEYDFDATYANDDDKQSNSSESDQFIPFSNKNGSEMIVMVITMAQMMEWILVKIFVTYVRCMNFYLS